MIRKIIGFLPVGFWLVMLFFGGADLDNPDGGWSFANIPWNLWVWFGLSVLSGVLLCFRRMLPIGLMVGIIPNAYLLLTLLPGGFSSVLLVPAFLTLFYVVYAVCYYTYHKEVNKP